MKNPKVNGLIVKFAVYVASFNLAYSVNTTGDVYFDSVSLLLPPKFLNPTL
jgi:hypothetical protein